MSRLRGGPVPPFDRTWSVTGGFSRIGEGEIGGKARGLAVLGRALAEADLPGAEEIEIAVPTLTVLGTGVFDDFMERNHLHAVVETEDRDGSIAAAFQRASLPTEILGDLRSLTEQVTTPLAVRSSGLLEDALLRPFAGVYETKMTPNNQPDANTRFEKLVEAVKLVYASTFFGTARDYLRTVPDGTRTEKMAIVIQNVVGARHGDRFYPHISGVSRTFNYYPSGGAPREDGVVELALGLGRIIVDEGISYAYVPSRPRVPPPFASVTEQLRNSQNGFWAINMGRPPAFDPLAETEYLVRAELADAEYDGTLRHVASTFDPASERLLPGTGRPGPRVLTFAPLLDREEFPVNRVVRGVMERLREFLEGDVEIEWAMTFPGPREPGKPQLGLVQVRPMAVSRKPVVIDEAELRSDALLLGSDHVMGNGIARSVRDVVYTPPATFDPGRTREVAAELGRINASLVAEGRPYVLIGFGRWGSQDPWLGIPVKWGQIAGARAIVEATLPDRAIDASQGTHFFHNLSAFGVSYFHVGHHAAPAIAWDRLESRPAESGTSLLRHVRFEEPLTIKVDGRTGRGGIWLPG